MNALANGRCPQCGVARTADASFCGSCGLLFITGTHPHRRESDQQRRTADLRRTSCRVCRGSIDVDALRCLHCGEILDPVYRAARARQLRAQINYASWIAYILGFLMLFVFRPVGIIAIVAGLLLSIAYYAIRIPDSEEQTGDDTDAGELDSGTEPIRESRLKRFLRRQFGVETVQIGSSRRGKFGLVLAGTPLLLVAIGWATNYSMLQIPIDQALASETEFPILEIAAHYEYFVVPGSIVLEIEKLGDPANAERALSQIAREFDGDRVEIRFGENSVRLDGQRFRALGQKDLRDLMRALHPETSVSPSGAPDHEVRIPIP